ncbi:response regulator [Shumkonia mesophila]|uniref:response regulator n=1 Tax=Shumkonia mesophila TaxID=2838854 RepID=UPI0029350C8E|nr:response regulator [Shumkonia mesophila]
MSEHILVVEDDPTVRSFIEEYLGSQGYRMSGARDGTTMRHIFGKQDVDLVILDLMLPGEDGLELAREIRSESDVPIIMVTGRADIVDRVVGLEIGADDYIPKPFEARELLARVRSVLRRSQRSGNLHHEMKAGQNTATFAGWRLDMGRRQLYAPAGEEIKLTSAEFDLLAAFISNPDKVLSRDRLLDLVYGREMFPFERSIDVLVMRLRGKIEEDRANPIFIKTVRGSGYVFTPEVKIQ